MTLEKEKFGAFVSALRKEQKLTQKELAQRLHTSDKAVSKWETGTCLPDVSLLMPLAEVLGVTVTELLRGNRKRARSHRLAVVRLCGYGCTDRGIAAFQRAAVVYLSRFTQ